MTKSESIKRWKLKIIANCILAALKINYRFVFYFEEENKDDSLLIKIVFRKWVNDFRTSINNLK